MAKKKSKNLLTYDKILDLYATNLEEGRIFLFKVLPKLAIHSPYHKLISANYLTEDIHWEMFVFLDGILTSNRSRQTKFYYLWFVFHKMHDSLNKTLKIYKEIYDDLAFSKETYEIDDVDWILEYLLELHWVLNYHEMKVYRIISSWWWVSKVIKELHTWYKDAKKLYDDVIVKTKAFISQIWEDATDLR